MLVDTQEILTRLRSIIVRNSSLAKIARQLQYASCLIGHKTIDLKADKLHADLFESVLGMIRIILMLSGKI